MQAAESSALFSLPLLRRVTESDCSPAEREREPGESGEKKRGGGRRWEAEAGERVRVYLHRQSLRSHGYHSGVSTSSSYRFIPNNLKN